MVAFVNSFHIAAGAKVERLEILERIPFAKGFHFSDVGAYELVRGRLHYSVHPSNPANTQIVDIELAPKDERGVVVFSGDFILLRPIEEGLGNQRLLYEVGNRGNIGILTYFNDALSNNKPSSLQDAGNGFLFREGYTLLWSAWNWDVTEQNNRMQIEIPTAINPDGSPIIGQISSEITTNFPNQCEPIVWGNSRGYPPVLESLRTGILTIRSQQWEVRHPLDRSMWSIGCTPKGSTQFNPTHLSIEDRFRPGFLYELTYAAMNPRVVGLGLSSIRDAVSFFRFEESDESGNINPLFGAIESVLLIGISQSGRVIQHMLYEDFHRDELGRMIFDGAMIHVAGAGKGNFNHRFAQTTRHPSAHEDHQYIADFFPFATVPQFDPVTGEHGDVLARAKKANAVPKLIYTNTSTEYWGRSASLLHTDVQGSADINLDDNARLYVVSGAQHGVWSFRHRAIFENCVNPVDYRPILRALLSRLGRWVENTELPPLSAYPRVADNQLGSVSQWRNSFPKMRTIRLPNVNLAPPRLDNGSRWDQGIIDKVPPVLGLPYTTLVPISDNDGIDLGGLRLPMVEEPLGTFVGWNLRRPEHGASDHIGRWSGSFIPFETNESRRKHTKDSRLSIERRYENIYDYDAAIKIATRALYERGFLLTEDFPRIRDRALQFYRNLTARDFYETNCDYTVF